MSIVFAGTPAFARASLEALIAAGHVPELVLTQPDRRAGRGRTLRASDVKLAALEHGIEVFQPRTLRSTDAQVRLRAHQPDLLIVAAYGLLLPAEVLAIPRTASVNVHASLLPRWRGAAPIQAAILAGDEETGISLMEMDRGLDTGPVYCRAAVSIETDETAAELHDRLAQLGGDVLVENLAAINAGDLKARPQTEKGATYAPRLTKADALIQWSDSASVIARAVRAYNPWPVSYTRFEGKLLKCWRAEAREGEPGALPGTILRADARGLWVACGEGHLCIHELQLAGRRRIAAADFCNQTAPGSLDGKRLDG